MKFPAINKQARRRVSIPQLSGGLNFRDGISQCNDNQLTDMLNMWYKDGLLKTRPGTKTIDMIAMVGYDVTTHPIQTDIFLDEHRLFCCVVSGSRKASDGISTITFAETVFWLQGKEEIKKLPTISKAINFVSLKNSVLYSFTSDRNIYKLDYKNNTTAWVLVQENEYYIPLVFYHCKNQSVSLLGDSGGLPYLSKVTYKATQLEDYNLLSSYYQMVYSTYSEAVEKN